MEKKYLHSPDTDGKIIGGFFGITFIIGAYINNVSKIEFLKIGIPLTLLFTGIGYVIGRKCGLNEMSKGLKKFNKNNNYRPPPPIYNGPTWKTVCCPFSYGGFKMVYTM